MTMPAALVVVVVACAVVVVVRGDYAPGDTVQTTQVSQSLSVDVSSYSPDTIVSLTAEFVADLCQAVSVSASRVANPTLTGNADKSSTMTLYILPPPAGQTSPTQAQVQAQFVAQYQSPSATFLQSTLASHINRASQATVTTNVALQYCSGTTFVVSGGASCPTTAPPSTSPDPSMIDTFPLWAIIATGLIAIVLSLLVLVVVVRYRRGQQRAPPPGVAALQASPGPANLYIQPQVDVAMVPVVQGQFQMYSQPGQPPAQTVLPSFSQAASPTSMQSAQGYQGALISGPVSFQTTTGQTQHQIKKGVGLKGIRSKKMGVDKDHLAQIADDSMPDTDTEY